MAEASLLHIANVVLGKLAPHIVDEIKSVWGAKEDLQRLVSTIEMIKVGLLDAEKRQESRDSEGELVRVWLRRLRNVLYDADDLFDKVRASDESKAALTGVEKLNWELSQFFSRSNPIYLQAHIAREVVKIRKDLDDIELDMGRFKFDRNLLENTVCYDREIGSDRGTDGIIGREEDQAILMGLLMDDAGKGGGSSSVDTIAIVGSGGLGKTTLAQLLYNNDVVKKKFELCAWACISDTKGKTSKARIILDALRPLQTYVTAGSSNLINADVISVDKLEREIHMLVQDKKYLLVVDDYWDEDRNIWLYLMGLLRGGKSGSKILVTARSSRVAIAMGVDSPYQIKGLADDKAWELFKRLAFKTAAHAEDQSIIAMGRDIAKKCKNVPLAIKAIASLLYTFGDNKREWKSIMDSDMLTLERKHQNLKILPVLKLSYDHLPSHLKHCFAFCSIFPKDFEIDGKMLILCWIAQGYVEQGYDREQSELMQIAETYLKELASRSFIEMIYFGIYKMHDLMHDLAQEVAGDEVLAVHKDICNDTGVKCELKLKEAVTRHLSFSGGVEIDDAFLTRTRAKYLRSFIHIVRSEDECKTHCISEVVVKKLAVRFSSLRILDLRNTGLKWLPSTVGVLEHLRYLNISENYFKHLPDEITKLHNLKVLDASYCANLETLPANFNNLVNLIRLVLKGCDKLTSMPSKFGELTSLEFLDKFIVREDSIKYSGLEELVPIVNLRGSLTVTYTKRHGGGAREEKTLDLSSSLVHVDDLSFYWPRNGDGAEMIEFNSFECSELPPNVKSLALYRFPGHKLPEWGKSFSNLQDVVLNGCSECRYLPSFGNHPRLRSLVLFELDELVYIQLDAEEYDAKSVLEIHLPCLERLEMKYLPKLKAWSLEMEKLGQQFKLGPLSYPDAATFPCFQSLTKLTIRDCPELTSMPLPPTGTLIESDFLKEPLLTLLSDVRLE